MHLLLICQHHHQSCILGLLSDIRNAVINFNNTFKCTHTHTYTAVLVHAGTNLVIAVPSRRSPYT